MSLVKSTHFTLSTLDLALLRRLVSNPGASACDLERDMPECVQGRTIRLSILKMKKRKLIKGGPRYYRVRKPPVRVIPLWITPHGKRVFDQHLEDMKL